MTGKRTEFIPGLAVSGGIRQGRAICLQGRLGDVFRVPLSAEQVSPELARLAEALRLTQEELRRIRSKVQGDLSEEMGAIFDAHLLILDDPAFVGRIKDRIRHEQVNADWAVTKTLEELAARFSRIPDEYLRERQEDLRDVGRHIIQNLQGVSHHDLSELDGEVIVVADDLTPSDAVRLGRAGVTAFAMECGGRTSHTSIIARSLNLPAVTGLPDITERVVDDDHVIVDGESGTVILHPTPELLVEYERRERALRDRERELLTTTSLRPVTRDGVEIQLMANIDLPEEIEDVHRFGATGIGLYRSEFLYIEASPKLPSEEEHLQIYRRLVTAAAPHPAVIRTYDLGGRKLAREMMETHEDNPVLGLRGVRLTLARPEVFRPQIRALFRAALAGDLWVLIPLVSAVEEVRTFREYTRQVEEELEREGVRHARTFKLGVMIEVPAAAIIADRLAGEVDFFSIGTNDLIQYSLAVDRNNEHVAALYQPLHPAILRMLRFVIDSAREAGIEVSVCGEMAADVHYASLLVGMGLRCLSVSPRVVPAIKNRIRELATGELEAIAEECLQQKTAAEVHEHLESFLARTLSVSSE